MLVELSPGAGSVDRSAPRLPNRQLWLIAALAVLPHLGGLWSGFVYDDYRFLVENPGVHDLDQPLELWRPERTSRPVDRDIWRPFRTVGLALQYQWFGGSARGYHLVSLFGLLLVVRAFLAWLSTLPGLSRSGVVFTGLLFGVHPLTVECVAWISSQGDLGAAACCFLCLALCHRHAMLAVICGVLAWFWKESAIPLAAVVALWSGPVRRLRPAPSRAALVGLVLLVFTLVYVVLRQSVLERGFGPGSSGLGQEDAPLGDRILAVAQNLHVGLRLFVWPHPLSVDYGFGGLPTPSVLDAVWSVLAAAVLWLLARGRSEPALVRRLGLLAALLFFLPTSGLLAPVKGQMAERFLLLPVACLSLVAGTWIGPRPSRTLRAVLLLGLMALAVRTAVRTHDWHSQQSLFEAELEVHPGSVQAHLALATEALKTGQFDPAARHFEEALARTEPPDPKRLGALYSLGAMAYEQGRRDTAWDWMQRCRDELRAHDPRDLDPVLGRTWVVLANLARGRDGAVASEALAREGLERFGRLPELLETLGVARDIQGDPAGAERLYREALELGAPASATLCYHLALALVHQGRTAEARDWLRRGLAEEPAHARCRALLGELGD